MPFSVTDPAPSYAPMLPLQQKRKEKNQFLIHFTPIDMLSLLLRIFAIEARGKISDK